MIRFQKNCFFDDPFSKIVFSKIVFPKKGFCQETFEKGLEKNKKLFKKSIQKSISKNQGQKSSQKAKPSPTKNRFKFQNNNPKNGAARGARRPIFGASARGASVVVLNFVSVFCKGLQELLAQLFFGLDFF